MLALGSPDTLRHVLWGRLKAIKDMRLPGRGQISWHCLGGTGRGGMLQAERSTVSKKNNKDNDEAERKREGNYVVIESLPVRWG